MSPDDGTALDLALELRAVGASAAELPHELRALMTADDREAIASILLGELAQRVRRETTTAGYQQNGRA